VILLHDPEELYKVVCSLVCPSLKLCAEDSKSSMLNPYVIGITVSRKPTLLRHCAQPCLPNLQVVPQRVDTLSIRFKGGRKGVDRCESRCY
jgi:hypothetical protein